MEVHEAGGGIHFTVEHTRKASQDELYVSLNKRLYDMMSTGTTCVECKSGYGLDTESEVKMLKVIETAKREHPLTISSTFCGAHAIPKLAKISNVNFCYTKIIAMFGTVRFYLNQTGLIYSM